ncbi:hypothetical protein HAX54_037711 [Datura stramonium]|uniref:Peptidase S9 prolyl oligopeptidase catalytic domain-containing protein n=1 Tax=Datura stramonium TaxID=4076 RepID=A0ABS8VJY6_DATST|nr:hypothetical protein [Datura stramonium]
MPPTSALSFFSSFAAVVLLKFLPVLLCVIPGKPVNDPLYQEFPKPIFSEVIQLLHKLYIFVSAHFLVPFDRRYLSIHVMASCPKEDIPNMKELLQEQNFYLTTEEGEQGRLPVLVLSMKETDKKKRPAIVFLHSTNKCKEWLRPLLQAYASRGYIAVAIDSRYHGERATNTTTYRDALISSWKKGDTMPFIYDTVWDLIKLADYLTEREDIDSSRIGITGESLGGMHAWFAAFANTRYAVVVPTIGVQDPYLNIRQREDKGRVTDIPIGDLVMRLQGFQWAIEHDQWQARVDSIKAVFEEARSDLGKNEIDKEVVQKVWHLNLIHHTQYRSLHHALC